MTIIITPSSPIEQTQTITKNITLIVVTSTLFDLVNDSITIYYNQTLDTGAIESSALTLTGDDANNFFAATATAGQTLNDLGVSTAVSVLQSKLGFTGTVS